MKKWTSKTMFAGEIVTVDRNKKFDSFTNMPNPIKKINIAQANRVVKLFLNEIDRVGWRSTKLNLMNLLYSDSKASLSLDQSYRASLILLKFMRWYWLPWSRIRKNIKAIQ